MLSSSEYLLILLILFPFIYLLVEKPAIIIHSGKGFPQASEKPFNFPKNILLSTDDSQWEHHVEPTMALGDDDRIYVGWKNAIEHDGGGKSVAYTYSMGGETWQDPIDMDPFWSTGSIQSDP